VVALKTQVDVLVQLSVPIHSPVAFVTARCGDLNFGGFQVREGIKTAFFPL
jgi:hypothetical protein